MKLALARRYKLFLFVAGLTLLLDQVSKYWARAALPGPNVPECDERAQTSPTKESGIRTYPSGTKCRAPVSFIGSFWSWELSYNPGSAFGLFRGIGGARIWLSIIGVGACVVIVLLLRKAKDDQKWLTTALSLVAGGAIGNVIDRILAGQVTDFVLWRIKGFHPFGWRGFDPWPAFNVADAALVAGVLILFLDIGRDQKRARLEKEKEERAKEKKK